MKNVCILLCAILITLSAGCSGKTVSTEGINAPDKMKSELFLIPDEYDVAAAVKDGHFVVLHGEAKSKPEIMDKFVSDSQNGKPSSITIVQYTVEGDPIITKVAYDGAKYYGIEDDTRDTFGNSTYHQFEFKYLKIFEKDGSKAYYLFNDNEITESEYTKSTLSSYSKDWIAHQFLCEYKN